MTFNIRFENREDLENCWEDRREFLCEVIRRHSPEIIGTQETTWHQIQYLCDHLPGYRLQASNRIIDDTCQYPTLFYRQERFEVTEGGDRWLSRTPLIHRSKDWDSTFPRMMSYGLFQDQETGFTVWAIVTHLDHQGREARWQQARLIASFIQRHSGACILMGDFNDGPDSEPHRLLTGAEVGLHDTWQTLGRTEGEQSMTHHGFTGTPQKTRMDWILVSAHFRLHDAQIVRDHQNGQYPSDHYPYLVDLEWR